MASPPPVVEYAVFFTLAAVLIFLVGEYLAWVYRDQANSDHEPPRLLTGLQRLDSVFTVHPCEVLADQEDQDGGQGEEHRVFDDWWWARHIRTSLDTP